MVILREGEKDKDNRKKDATITQGREGSNSKNSSMERIKQRSRSGNQRWKRQANSKQRRSEEEKTAACDKDTPVVSNRKRYDGAADVSMATASSTNLFLQMGDHEVGNHTSHDSGFVKPMEESYLSHSSQVTGSTAAMSLSSASHKESALGSAAAGLKFHPHTEIGGSLNEDDYDDEEDEDYYPTPITKDAVHLKTEEGRKNASTPNNRPPKPPKSSPQSVMEGMPSTLTSFPRYKHLSKKKGGIGCHPVLRHDSSYEDSTMAEDDNTLGGSVAEDDEDEDDMGVRLQRVLFGNKAPLNKFYDAITGNMCWSGGQPALIGRLQEGCADSTNAEALIDDYNDIVDDYDYEVDEGEDSLIGFDEEENTIGSVTVDDETLGDLTLEEEVSYDGGLSQTDSSAVSSVSSRDMERNMEKKGVKNPGSTKKKSQQQQPNSNKKSPKKLNQKGGGGRRSQPRRGRSPTARHSYNSDGESIRQSSQSSQGSPRGGSLSLSTRGTSAPANEQYEEPIMIQGVPLRSPHRLALNHNEGDSDPSVIAEEESVVESVAESVLTHDRIAWMAMTQVPPPRSAAEARDEVDDENNSARTPTHATATPAVAAADNVSASAVLAEVVAGSAASSARDPSPSSPYREANAIDGYFKKLLTVGIQLLFNDPPPTSETMYQGPRLHRTGKMFLQFGVRGDNSGIPGEFEQPRLFWTDGQSVSHSLELLDIASIRPPHPYELEGSYPFAIPDHSFFLFTNDGTTLLFEAVDEVQMIRVTTALRGIIGRLAKKIVMGENDWLVQMMMASVGCRGHEGGNGDSSGGGPQQQQRSSLDGTEDNVPGAMADITDHLVRKQTSGLMRQAQERRSRLRSTRAKQHPVMMSM
mmetsp:Transcript_1198/g.2995  ORF Transcript_1198/g.2995 Transcript_1198/m.2995 type:complete len:865 (-) Transcript_1198:165-2759(-)